MFIPTTSRSFGPNLPEAIEFWESKDPNEHYDFSKGDICACGQYAAAIGDTKEWKNFAHPIDNPTRQFWRTMNTLAGRGDHTFGALAKRARDYADC